MGDPLTITAAAGMGTSLLGGVLRGGAEQSALAAKARADQQNQQLAQQQAGDALRMGAIRAGQIRMKADQVIGQQRAGYGASGVDANTGSAAQVQAGARAMSELDVAAAQNNAAREAWGYNVTASQYGQQAKLDQQGESESGLGTFLGAAGGVASGVGGLFRAAKGDPFGGTL